MNEIFNTTNFLSVLTLIIVYSTVVIFNKIVIPYIKVKISTEDLDTVYSIIDSAVRFAEQTIKGEKTGNLKKTEVIEFVQKFLKERNINLSDEELSTLIEAAVYNLNKEK